jgi:polysaccharide chain length determinant protein (PEP-CTERM system associated)
MTTEASAIDLKDIPEIILRRRWLILLPLFAAVIAGLYLSFTKPKVYEASTLIFVQPQQVPKEFVRSVVNEQPDSRLSTIKQQIMSETNLERIIKDFNLFSGPDYENMFFEDKITKLRESIAVNVTREKRGSDTFRISYKGSNPQKVMQVTNKLANNFIDANIKDRQLSADSTSFFLAEELENTKNSLRELESRLKDYKQQFMGELPEQLNSNLSILGRLQEQLNAKEENLRSIRASLSMVEQQIAAEPKVAVWGNESGGDRYTVKEKSSNDPEVLKNQLADLLSRYTEQHPDVANLKRKIAEIESKQSGDGGESSPLYVSPLQRQRNQLMKEKLTTEANIANLNQQIQVYRARVENAPKREQELHTLERDYQNLSGLYKSLLNRKQEADMSVSLEKKQQDGQFRIIDYARLPTKPMDPGLLKTFFMSIAIGLGSGCGLAYLLEFFDSSYRKPERVEEDFNIPVIATIPAIQSPKAAFKKRVDLVLWSVFVAVTLLLIAGFYLVSLNGADEALKIVNNSISL